MFLKNGNIYQVQMESFDTVKELPVANYNLVLSDYDLILVKSEPFKTVPKLYGNVIARTQKILNTFQDRQTCTGVLLEGTKGSGKSLLARNICIESNLPVVIVNSKIYGDKFNQLVQKLEQPCIFLFDEFEKTYCDKSQQALLTVLDGVIQSKKLFIFTCNNTYHIDRNMINRPGRIYYNISYDKIDTDAIRDYVNENLKNKKYIKDIFEIAEYFNDFNFDTLKSLVEESNRYNESPFDSLQMLNISQPDMKNKYEISLYKEDKFLGREIQYVTLSPIHEIEIYIPKFTKEEVSNNYDDDEEEDDTNHYTNFYYTDIISKDLSSFVSVNDDGYKIVCNLQKIRNVS